MDNPETRRTRDSERRQAKHTKKPQHRKLKGWATRTTPKTPRG